MLRPSSRRSVTVCPGALWRLAVSNAFSPLSQFSHAGTNVGSPNACTLSRSAGIAYETTLRQSGRALTALVDLTVSVVFYIVPADVDRALVVVIRPIANWRAPNRKGHPCSDSHR